MLLRLAVEMNTSFRSLRDSRVLREFLLTELGWQLPSRMTISRLLPVYYGYLVNNLKQRLSGIDSINITTDSTFLTRHQLPYIAVTGQWIDANWTLHSEVLAVFLAQQQESADFISSRLKLVLETQLGLGNKLHCIMTDDHFAQAAGASKTSYV